MTVRYTRTTLIYWNITFGCLGPHTQHVCICELVWMRIVFVYFSHGQKGKKPCRHVYTHTFAVTSMGVFYFYFFLLLLLALTNSVNLHKISFTPCFPSFLKTHINHIHSPAKGLSSSNILFFARSVLFSEGIYLCVCVCVFFRWRFYCSVVVIILVCCLLEHQIILRPNQSNEQTHSL